MKQCRDITKNKVHVRKVHVCPPLITRGVCKIGDFIKFKGFLAEFLENRRSWENQQPQKSGLFWASPFTMHLVCTLLIGVFDLLSKFGAKKLPLRMFFLSSLKLALGTFSSCALLLTKALRWREGIFQSLRNYQYSTYPLTHKIITYQGRKRHPNTKISPRIPCPNPPFLGAFNPRNSLCSCCAFSLKYRKNANTKNFEGGRWRGRKKSLC